MVHGAVPLRVDVGVAALAGHSPSMVSAGISGLETRLARLFSQAPSRTYHTPAESAAVSSASAENPSNWPVGVAPSQPFPRSQAEARKSTPRTQRAMCPSNQALRRTGVPTLISTRPTRVPASSRIQPQRVRAEPLRSQGIRKTRSTTARRTPPATCRRSTAK